MENYDAIVIGAGNGGLVSALSLAKRGLNVLLLEKHNIPGGCATSFIRGRFEFDVSLHQLNGIGSVEKPGPLRMLFNEIGVMDDLDIVFMEDIFRVAVEDKVDFILRPDRASFTNELQKNFPRDAKNIEEFMDFMYALYNETLGFFIMQDPAPTPEKYPLTLEYGFKSCTEVMNLFFTDPVLQTSLTPYWGYLGTPPSRLSFSYFSLLLISFIETVPCHVKGGSQALSHALLNRFLLAGGTARFNCAGKRIDVENGRVRGVTTEEGERIPTHHIVSNASKIRTYVDMIDEAEIPPQIMTTMRGQKIAVSAFSIYMGLDCEPEECGITESTTFVLDNCELSEKLLARAGNPDRFFEYYLLTCYTKIHPDFSPPGTTTLSLVTGMMPEFWRRLPPQQYADVKYEITNRFIDHVEKKFPNLRSRIEEIESATPLTMTRYLGHPGGSFYGFEKNIKDSFYMQPENESYIRGLYLAGASAGGGGYFPTLLSGQIAARQLMDNLDNV